MKNVLLTILCFATMAWFANAAGGQSYEARVRSYGLTVPSENVTLRSNMDSHVKKVRVREGEKVRRGDILVELKCDTALAKLRIAELAAKDVGTKLNALAELKFAKSRFAKIKALYRQKAVNKNEFQEALLRLESAEASLQIAKETHAANQARFELEKAEYESHFVYAPFDGEVVELIVNEGSPVTSSTDILRLASLDKLKVDLYLPLSETNALADGQRYALKIEEPFGIQHASVIESKLVFFSPIIEATTGARRVTLEIDNRKLQLPAGFSVTLLGEPLPQNNDWLEVGIRNSIGFIRSTCHQVCDWRNSIRLYQIESSIRNSVVPILLFVGLIHAN